MDKVSLYFPPVHIDAGRAQKIAFHHLPITYLYMIVVTFKKSVKSVQGKCLESVKIWSRRETKSELLHKKNAIIALRAALNLLDSTRMVPLELETSSV